MSLEDTLGLTPGWSQEGNPEMRLSSSFHRSPRGAVDPGASVALGSAHVISDLEEGDLAKAGRSHGIPWEGPLSAFRVGPDPSFPFSWPGSLTTAWGPAQMQQKHIPEL
jgi:hypothetical protein